MRSRTEQQFVWLWESPSAKGARLEAAIVADASYLVPIQDIEAKQVAVLRVDAPTSQQRIGIRWATPYALVRQATSSRPANGETERKTGFEPATPYLASRCATAAPLPLETPNDIEPHQ